MSLWDRIARHIFNRPTALPVAGVPELAPLVAKAAEEPAAVKPDLKVPTLSPRSTHDAAAIHVKGATIQDSGVNQHAGMHDSGPIGTDRLPIGLPGAIPAAAVDIVAHFEGYRSDAYLCPAGVYTMGYGSTRNADGVPVRPGMRVSEAEARALLMRDLAGAARAVTALVSVPLSEHERAALVSFVYNVGQGAFASSTLLRLLNAGDRAGAVAQFSRWNKSRGNVLPGLTRRRAAEEAMFNGLDWRQAA